MKYKVINKSNMDFDKFRPILSSFMSYATKKMGFKKPPSLFFASDEQNANLPLGKTAHYDPNTMQIVVYTDLRHPKDILRSLSHELVHHKQNCDGQFDNLGPTVDGYAQNDKHLRSMEKEAYLLGNMCLRDWEDTHKKHLQESNYYSRGDRKMNTKDWSRKELNTLLMEKFGYEKKKEPVLEEEEEELMFAPSHYCAHHVVHEGREAFTVDHNFNESLGKVTKYDLKFEDGTIKRNVHVDDLTILEESNHGGKRDPDHPPVKKDKEIGEALDDGETTGSDSVDAGLDDNPEFTQMDLAAEKGGKRAKGKKKKKVTEAQLREAIQEIVKRYISK